MSIGKRFLSVLVLIISCPSPAWAGPEQPTHSEAGSGGDNCNEATPHALSVPGAISIFGNNATATGPDDCPGFNMGTIWWEAFTITQCADAEVDLCGSTPTLSNVRGNLQNSCSADGSTCTGYIGWTEFSFTICDDENIWLFFRDLPAGTYYYPINSDTASDYQMNITTFECTGACCNPMFGTCAEDITEPDCSGVGDQWFQSQTCLETGCTGACCNTSAGTCTEDVNEPNCSAAGDQWFPTQTCLETGCTGACCNQTAVICTEDVTESNCANAGDEWFSSQTCVTSGCQGACCSFQDQACEVNVFSSQCQGDGDIFSSGEHCCGFECRDLGASEYDAFGVKLLSRVSIADFSADFGSSHSSAREMWGYASPGGREYAIIALTGATAFVDVTDPVCPIIVEQIPGVAKDVKTLGSYALVVTDDAPLGLQIIDMSLIDSGVVTLATTANPGGFTRAHNIAVNEESSFAYLTLTDQGGGFIAVDMADPLNPVAVGDCPQCTGHDIQVVSYTSGPYAGREIVFSSRVGLHIVDVTDKSNTFTRGIATHPNQDLSHQGWLSEDRRYFFLGDEFDEINFDLPTTTYVFDVQDLDNPFLHTTFTNNLCSTDHNQMVRGTKVYQANYKSGLRVYDISDIDNIREVGHFDTFPESNATGFSGAWGTYPLLPSGVILVSDKERGLFVLKECQGLDCEPGPLCCPLSDSPQPPEVVSHADQPKNRSLSIAPGNAGRQTALRVTLTTSATFPDDVGMQWWVAAPAEICENSGQGPATPPANCGPAPGSPKKTMWSSALSCFQTCVDWATLTDVRGDALDVLHISDPDIVTGSTYTIEAIDCDCDPLDSGNFSAPLVLITSRWGDLSGGLPADCPRQGPDTSVGLILDCVAVLNKFSNSSCAMLKSRADMEPHDPDQRINITDVLQCINAFSGLPYPYLGPVGCP